MTKITFRNRI